ncbi:MAG: hypothetical protein ACYC5O_06835 [Anaerolineae bacterium]
MSNPHCSHGTGDDGASQCPDEAPASRLAGLVTRPQFISWPCRDCFSGSLYPLPPEQCRRDVFCGRCTAANCLFGGTPADRRLRRGRRRWSMPDDYSLDLYIDALKLYAGLLEKRHTCWHCANLRLMRGRGGRYVCPHNLRLLGAQPHRDARALPSLSMGQAKLLSALEGCESVHFAPRLGPVPAILPAYWRDAIVGGDCPGGCARCLHLRSLVVAGRERFVCGLEAGRAPRELAWRLARSWRVVQARGSDGVWCRGREWRPRAGAISPLAVAAATA